MAVIQVLGREVEVSAGDTIEDAMHANGFHPDSFLYLDDGKPVPMDTVISDTSVIRAVKVASGG
jgi:sulfur carrier protein ThiS